MKNRATMKEKGKKPLQTQNPTNFTDFTYSAPEIICKKHPKAQPIGICSFCLREKLQSLICSVCGEQNVYSYCPCSLSKRNSNFSDVGSVGRISFLLENEKQAPFLKTQILGPESDKPRPILKSSGKKPDIDQEEAKKNSGFWRIMKIFMKNKEKVSTDRKSNETWIFEQSSNVSRSRSLCSLRDSTSDFTFSSAKISDFNSSSERPSNFSETEPRKSVFSNTISERESGFIELKIGNEFGKMRMGGSCRITEKETKGMSREMKGKKVWKWILKHNYANWRSRSKRDD